MNQILDNVKNPILDKEYKDIIIIEINQLEEELENVKDKIESLELKQEELNNCIMVLDMKEKIYEYVKDYAGLKSSNRLIGKIANIKKEKNLKEEEYEKIFSDQLKKLDDEKNEIETIIEYLKNKQLKYID